MPFDCFARGCDVHAADVHELAIGQNAGPRDVQENADTVRRGLRDRHDIVNAIGALRPRVDERSHAVCQADRRHLFRAGMRVDVDQAGDDELAGGIEGIHRIRR